MSIRRMSAVWESSKQKGANLLLLLAIADFASDDGFAWPGIRTLAQKIRMSDRQVPRLLRQIEMVGELYTDHRGHRGKSNRYVVLVGLTDAEIVDVLTDKIGRTQEEAREFVEAIRRDDKLSPLTQLCQGGDDKLSGGDDIAMAGGDDIAMSSDPSLTVIETIIESPLHPPLADGATAPKVKQPKAKTSAPKLKDTALLPDTLQARTMFGRLQANAKANGRRGPGKFPSLEVKEKFDAAAARLDGQFEKALVTALEQGCTSVVRVTNYVAGFDKEGNGNGKRGREKTGRTGLGSGQGEDAAREARELALLDAVAR